MDSLGVPRTNSMGFIGSSWAVYKKGEDPTKVRATPLAKEKRSHMTEKSLGLAGTYGVRLDPGHAHFPQAVPDNQKRTAVCQLHRLANKVVISAVTFPKERGIR